MVDRLTPPQRAIFATTVFAPHGDAPVAKGDPLLCSYMFMHEIRPQNENDGKGQLHFLLGNSYLSYGAEEFCLITGLKFGRVAGSRRLMKKVQSTFVERVFGERMKPAELATGDLHTVILQSRFRELSDEDAVRCVLLYILCAGYLSKEKNEKVTVEWLSVAENFDDFNR